MATIAMSTDLDVLNKYNELIEQSLGSDSVYIRTKETLDALVSDGDLSGPEKADVISSVLGSLNTSIVNSSMSTALQWESAEKELELKRLELEKQLDILDKEVDTKQAQIDKLNEDNYATHATSLRNNGNAIIVDGKVVSLGDTGKAYEEIELVKAKTANTEEEFGLIGAKKDEINAGIHKIVADTYVNYGTYHGYTISGSGINGAIPGTTHQTLSDLQATIAQEQAKGYAYNAWSNAASGLGATIGTALTTESDIFGGTGSYPDILSDWASIVKELKDVQVASV